MSSLKGERISMMHWSTTVKFVDEPCVTGWEKLHRCHIVSTQKAPQARQVFQHFTYLHPGLCERIILYRSSSHGMLVGTSS